jgi:hypothetical protein
MNDLDPQARAIFGAAREADRPSRRDYERNKKVIMMRIAAGAAISTGLAATSARAATMSLTSKLSVALVAVSLAGGGVATYVKVRGAHRAPTTAPSHTAKVGPGRSPAPPAPPLAPVAPAPEAAAKPEPAVLAPAASTGASALPAPASAVPALGPAVPAPATPARRAAPPQPLPPRSTGDGGPGAVERSSRGPREPEIGTPDRMMPAEAMSDRLATEVEVLKLARQELRANRPERALQILGEDERRFGDGPLGEERRALTAIARCQAQPGTNARALAEAFVRSSPQSPLRGHVLAACRGR